MKIEFLKKDIAKDILINLGYLILITIYFICFNIQGSILESSILIKHINILSLIFLVISIILLEIGLKKDKNKIFINGIEILILAIFTLLMKHIPKILDTTMDNYIKIGIFTVVAYYILKSAIMYTNNKQNELKNLSDIKEIVKEEPTKKATKRKNIKVKEGN